tara:strand:+ start:2008 stop:2436 length:429 start_codon:yes stop_codon:yes gene_type:complete
MSVKELGTDQIKWLSEFKSIELDNWRMEHIPIWTSSPSWYYIGNDNITVAERKHNLELDKYYYWPKKTSIINEKWNPKYVGSSEKWRNLWEAQPAGKNELSEKNITEFCNHVWFTEKSQPVIGGPDRRKEFAFDLYNYIVNL